ncbi:MAG: DUF6263 family protein, partial [Planctomycetota bacterium]|jgi:hypothetical protein
VGKTYRLKRNERGKILEVKGFTEIGKEIMKKVEESMEEGDPRVAMTLAALKGQFTDKGQKKTHEQDSKVWPEEAVDVGMEWEDHISVSVPRIGKAKLAVKNKVETIEEGVIKGAAAGKMKEDEDEEEEDEDEGGGGNPMAGMFKIISGKMSGTFEFDAGQGLLLKKVEKAKITAKLVMMDQEVPVVVTRTEELIKITHGVADEGPGEKKEEEGKEDGDF